MSMTKTANWEAICDMTDDDYFEDELWCREPEDEKTTDFSTITGSITTAMKKLHTDLSKARKSSMKTFLFNFIW